MSGECTSRQGGKRRRGPVPRPRGIIDTPVQDYRPPKRRIAYHTPEVIPVNRPARERDHPLLQFELGTKEALKFETLKDTPDLAIRTIDWGMLDITGERERIELMVRDKFRDVLCCSVPQFRELTLEFLCTFKHKEGTFDEYNAVSFSLGRCVHEMTMAEFAVATQFYTLEEVQSSGFHTSLRGVSKNRKPAYLKESDLAQFWSTISDAAFSTNMLSSEIRDPVIRYLHKAVATTIVGRGSGENKINQLDLFCLCCMVEQREANLTCILASSFKRGRRGGNRASLDMGLYITMIARSLGVFNKYGEHLFRRGPVVQGISINDLRMAGILKVHSPVQWEEPRVGVQVQPPPDTEAAASMRGGLPPHYQRPLHRMERPAQQYPIREPPPESLTLEYLHNRMESGFNHMQNYMQGQFREIRDAMQQQHQRHEDNMRWLFTGLHIDLPPHMQPQYQPGSSEFQPSSQHVYQSTPSIFGPPGGSQPTSGRFENVQPYHVFGEEEKEEDSED